jgi:hypothetical protein
MSDDLLKRLTYFAFKLEGKGQLESAASDTMVEAAARFAAHSTAIDDLRAEVERLRPDNERLTRQRDKAWVEVERLRSELALMKSGFEIAYRAMGDKP